jgi:hypothetical protein
MICHFGFASFMCYCFCAQSPSHWWSMIMMGLKWAESSPDELSQHCRELAAHSHCWQKDTLQPAGS